MAYPSVNEQAVLKAAEQLMERTMARYDPSHDAYHVQRVRKTAVSLAHSVATSTPNSRPDLFTVELAALLHDVLDKKYVTAAEAADPYRFFEPFFEQMATEYHVDLVSDGRAKTVARIIDNVSWTTEKKLRESGQWSEWHDNCVELHCVQDADRLDAIGAFGVMRCAAFASISNNALYTPADDPLQDKSAVKHFHDKLVHIYQRLKTEPGRKLGKKRHQLILDFLKAVDEEVNIAL